MFERSVEDLFAIQISNKSHIVLITVTKTYLKTLYRIRIMLSELFRNTAF